MAQSQVQINGKRVGRLALGIMAMAGFGKTSQEDAIAAIKTAVDLGENVINAATFYGPPTNPMASLQLLKAFFEAHSDYVDKTVVCVKGGIVFAENKISLDLDFLRDDVQKIQAAMGDKKKLDVFVMARQPRDGDIEALMKNLVTLKDEGHFTGIGLSEVSASTLRRAHAVHPIAAVENELSLFNLTDDALEVVKACEELGIAYTAYSPLGRGLLTKKYLGLKEMPADDIRSRFPRFQGANFTKNLELGQKVEQLAEAKGRTAAQYALAYILRLSPVVVPLQGPSAASRIIENHEALKVQLTDDEVSEIDKILASFEVSGDRYPEMFAKDLMK